VNAAAPARKVAAARLWATAHAPYLASAIFASSVRIDPDAGTIAIDRSWQIRADPALLDTLSVPELGRLLIHLCAHLIRDHATRARTRGVQDDNRRAHWNRAADAEINDDLVTDGLAPASAPDRPVDLGCEDGKLAEHYYDTGTEGQRRWDCGSGAAGWQRWAETVLPSRTDWRRALAAEIRRGIALTSGTVDYSYHRPSRRAHLTDDLVLPTLVRPVPEVAIVCDTSGSMHDTLLARALAEIDGILTRAGLRRGVPVLAVDTAVHAVRRVVSSRQVKLAGGGGTDMGQGIEAAAELRPRPSVIIVLTDGFTPWPHQPPRGARVIVGLLTQTEMHHAAPAGPDWARTILIDEAA
jgi:predicted metal-dependent peptidase